MKSIVKTNPVLPENWPVKGNGGKLVGPRDVAALLGLAASGVASSCSRGTCKVPHYKIGGVYRFDIADVEDFIRKARVEGKNEKHDCFNERPSTSRLSTLLKKNRLYP